MTNPSEFFKECGDLCGSAGRAYIRAHQFWTRPSGVPYPTIRRVDWASAALLRRGRLPSPRSGSDEERERYRSDVFVWAHGSWMSFFGRQLDGFVSRKAEGFNGRECHPFTLGYVRGAIEQLVSFAALEEDRRLMGFMRVGAIADVFGLDWVDELDDAISDLASGRLPASSTAMFHDGAERGTSDMNRFLDGSDPDPRKLGDWLEGIDRIEPHTPMEGGPKGTADGRCPRVECSSAGSTGEPQ
jgi:hypothetical protein